MSVDNKSQFTETTNEHVSTDRQEFLISNLEYSETSSSKMPESSNLVDAIDFNSMHLKPPSFFKSHRRRSKTYSGEELGAHLERISQLSASEPTKSQEDINDLPIINKFYNKRSDLSTNRDHGNLSNNRRFLFLKIYAFSFLFSIKTFKSIS